MHETFTRRSLIAAAGGAAALAVSGAVAARQATPEATPGATPGVGETRTVEHSRGTSVIPAEPQRVVALGEEFLLADLLTLGVPVVASSATVTATGFAALDAFDTSGIEVLDAIEPDLERLVEIAPDLIVAAAYVWDGAGEEVLTGIAPTIVVFDEGSDWRESLLSLGGMLGAGDAAQTALDAYDDAVADAREELAPEGRSVSIATVYPGASIAIWIDGPVNIPQTVLDLGFTLEPGPGSIADASNGRAFISAEQTNLLSGDHLLMLQSEAVEDEPEAYDEVISGPLWQTLPAVQADRVTVLDRLGYPGVAGRQRLVGDLVEALADGEEVG